MTYELSRNQINLRLAMHVEAVGVSKTEFLNLVSYQVQPNEHNSGNLVTNDFKIHIRVSRHNSIHVSPTVMVNGLIESRISSSWDLETWKKYLSELNWQGWINPQISCGISHLLSQDMLLSLKLFHWKSLEKQWTLNAFCHFTVSGLPTFIKLCRCPWLWTSNTESRSKTLN